MNMLEVVNKAIEMFEFHEAEKDERDNETKPSFYSFKLEAIHDGSRLYEAISSALYDFEIDDNSRYEFAHDALITIQETLENDADTDIDDYDIASEAADSATPVYTYDLLQWLATSLKNYSWVEDAINEFGWNNDLPQAIMQGYARAWTDMYMKMVEVVKEEFEACNSDE